MDGIETTRRAPFTHVTRPSSHPFSFTPPAHAFLFLLLRASLSIRVQAVSDVAAPVVAAPVVAAPVVAAP
eukprot:4520458-Prymnesium_polylepis.2